MLTEAGTESLSDGINKLIIAHERHQFRYINTFFNWKSAADIAATQAFNMRQGGKELTESIAALNASYKLGLDRGDDSVTCVCVGDGSTPRTAVIFAHHTKWNIISIDPNLREKCIPYWTSKVQRLTCIREMIEDINLNFDGPVLIVAVHSHAPVKEVLNRITSESSRSMIAIPCCISYDNDKKPDIVYRDSGIWSPKNNVMIWRKI